MHYDYVNKCVHSATSVSSLHDMTGSSLQWVKKCIVIVHIFNGEMEIYWTTESVGEVEGLVCSALPNMRAFQSEE